MKKSRIFWGLSFIVAAILLLLDRTHLIGDINIISLLITLILLYCLIKGIIYRSPSSIIYPIALLCIMYDDVLGIAYIGTWTILIAATLLSIGCSFLFPKRKTYYHTYTDASNNDTHMYFHTSFKENIQYINSTQFEKANIQCNFGHSKIYLDNAKMLNEYAYINVEGSFCGIDLFVPKEWAVDNRVECIFGSIKEHTPPTNATSPVLVLQGKISFGELTITYI